MTWYLINIFAIVLAWIAKIKTDSDLRDKNGVPLALSIRKKRTCIVGTVNWVLLSGFRAWDVGADTLAYKIYRFDTTMALSWKTVFLSIPGRFVSGTRIKDPAYTLLEKIFQVFSSSYQLWLVVIAVIFIVPMGIWIYKESNNPCVSFILFSTLFYSFFAITGHRQTIATAIVVWGGLVFINKRKLIPYLLVCAAAFLVHASAICFVPFYWISKIKINKVTIIAYWIAIIASFAMRNSIVNTIHSDFGYEYFSQLESARFGAFAILLFFVAIVISFFHKRIEERGGALALMSMNALYTACFFSPLLLVNQSYMRIVQYYSIFLLFLLPEIQHIFKRKDVFIYNLSICAIMILLLIINRPTYHFFFI